MNVTAVTIIHAVYILIVPESEWAYAHNLGKKINGSRELKVLTYTF